ncbi:MAG: ATP-binding protein [Ardenticatenaceae bacterium]|nr:ATP-binding protein [Ardenticatenaceae bacterium]
MAVEWSQPILQRYIDQGIEESLTLEYKSAEALYEGNGREKEIAKDVSAMANSAGGIIIYGISEHQDRLLRFRPHQLTPVDRTICSKETLEQIISSNIQPRISGIKIFPVPLSSSLHHVAYVVRVPQSDTVHQVARTKRYYKRFNFESVPMEDFEIRDVLNRTGEPIVASRVGHMTVEKINDEWIWSVPIFAKNDSMTVAKDTALTVEFLDARPENHIAAEKFVIKTQPKPSPYKMYISAFDEAIHKGLNKWFGTFKVTVHEPQALTVKVQVFANGMRARWWVVKLNFGENSATIQVLDEGYLY